MAVRCEACRATTGRRVSCVGADRSVRKLCSECAAIWQADQVRPGGASVLDALAGFDAKVRQLALPFRSSGGGAGG